MNENSPIGVQSNLGDGGTMVCHSFDLPGMCPVSGNPQPGSKIEVWYKANAFFLEIETLGEYIQSYIGGKPMLNGKMIRDMEQTIQQIARDCAQSVEVDVVVIARLKIADDPQERLRVRDYRVIQRANYEKPMAVV
mgnify:CR=1 FL=1